MKQVRFKESEVPYQTLAGFGLTQEKIEDLPLWALEDIGHGRRSPLLPIQVTNDEGETLKSRIRFALVRMEDGKVDVVFYPQSEKSPLLSAGGLAGRKGYPCRREGCRRQKQQGFCAD